VRKFRGGICLIKFGFNTLAMLTYGLGIRIPWPSGYEELMRIPKIVFRNKPPGIAAEDKTGPASFEDRGLDFEDDSIKFEDR